MADGTREPEAPWLDTEQLQNWKSLVAMLMLVPPALDAQLKRDAGLNSFEYHVLASLSDAPGRTLAMSELATLAQGSASRLSHAVSRLEQAGWVARRSCPGVRRHTEATLTPAGWRKLRQSAPGHVREARRLVVDVLTPQQLQALGAAARAVVATIDTRLARQLSHAD
ncbi:MAG: MarR family winged helix-turn-helix transcriptional regulator [Dermatophilaceae bacterium]